MRVSVRAHLDRSDSLTTRQQFEGLVSAVDHMGKLATETSTTQVPGVAEGMSVRTSLNVKCMHGCA